MERLELIVDRVEVIRQVGDSKILRFHRTMVRLAVVLLLVGVVEFFPFGALGLTLPPAPFKGRFFEYGHRSCK